MIYQDETEMRNLDREIREIEIEMTVLSNPAPLSYPLVQGTYWGRGTYKTCDVVAKNLNTYMSCAVVVT